MNLVDIGLKYPYALNAEAKFELERRVKNEQSWRLFIADDEPGFRTFVRRVAEGAGWDVTECSDGIELLSELERNTANGLILLDMMMPRMNGVEAIIHFHDLENKLPVCMITGGPFVQMEAARLVGNAEGLPIVGTLYKPVKIDELLAIFDDCRNGKYQDSVDMWSGTD